MHKLTDQLQGEVLHLTVTAFVVFREDILLERKFQPGRLYRPSQAVEDLCMH